MGCAMSRTLLTKENSRIYREVSADADTPACYQSTEGDKIGRAACSECEYPGHEQRNVESPSAQPNVKFQCLCPTTEV